TAMVARLLKLSILEVLIRCCSSPVWAFSLAVWGHYGPRNIHRLVALDPSPARPEAEPNAHRRYALVRGAETNRPRPREGAARAAIVPGLPADAVSSWRVCLGKDPCS